MAYTLNFEKEALRDIERLRKSGNKAVINKLEKLLVELIEHPLTGTGQVEALRGNYVGYWSRRIDQKNRLLYMIEETTVTVTIVSVLGHYGDK